MYKEKSEHDVPELEEEVRVLVVQSRVLLLRLLCARWTFSGDGLDAVQRLWAPLL